MIEKLIHRYSFFTNVLIGIAIISTGVVPFAVLSWLKVPPRDGIPFLLLCIPLSFYGLWLVTRALDKQRHWKETLSDVVRGLIVSTVTLAAMVAVLYLATRK